MLTSIFSTELILTIYNRQTQQKQIIWEVKINLKEKYLYIRSTGLPQMDFNQLLMQKAILGSILEILSTYIGACIQKMVLLQKKNTDKKIINCFVDQTFVVCNIRAFTELGAFI